MPIAQIRFFACAQHEQIIDPNEPGRNYLIASARFDMAIDGVLYPGQTAELHQAYGTSFAAPIEACWTYTPAYDGPWNHNAFNEVAEQYYRLCVGEGGAINPGPSCQMYGNVIAKPALAVIELPT